MSKPVYDLRKKPTKEDYFRDFNCWCQRNFYIIAVISIVLSLLVFVFVCYNVVGVCAVESGGMRNFLAGGV